MRKFFATIRKNIFYISLVAGLFVLVGLVALYNIKTSDDGEINMITTTEAAPEENMLTTSGSGDKAEAATEAATGTADASAKKQTEGTEKTTEDVEAEETLSDGAESDKQVLNYDGTESITWPISGNVIIPYSMDRTVYFATLKEYKCNPGMMIEAMAGDEVVAAYEAEVTAVSTSAEFGNTLTLSLGNGYEITYGQLEDIDVAVGDIVEAGQVVATVAEPTKYYSEEGTHLYFAITKDGSPVDPLLLTE